MFKICTICGILKSLNWRILAVNYYLPILFALILGGGLFSSASAHTTVQVEQYEIEVNWGIEPPVVGFRNTFVFEVSVPGEVEGVKSGVKNAFKSLDSTAKFGGLTKELDINSDPKPGHYFSNVIPTKTGSISILLSGEIDGTTIQVEIPVEDVETTAVLDFPPRTGSSDSDTAGLKNALSALQQDVNSLKSKLGGVDEGSNLNAGPAYDFAVFGLSLGAAGVILAIIAMIKRK